VATSCTSRHDRACWIGVVVVTSPTPTTQTILTVGSHGKRLEVDHHLVVVIVSRCLAASKTVRLCVHGSMHVVVRCTQARSIFSLFAPRGYRFLISYYIWGKYVHPVNYDHTRTFLHYYDTSKEELLCGFLRVRLTIAYSKAT